MSFKDTVDRTDDAVERAIDKARNPALDRLNYGLGSAADHSLIWHAIAAVVAARKGDVKSFVRMSSALGIESFLTNVVIKSMFRRTRPRGDLNGPSETRPESLPYGMRVPITTSFPSGHATSAFLAATILHDETGSDAWYALATLVAASRVYTKMHHPSDVVAGAALGYTLGRVWRVAWPR